MQTAALFQSFQGYSMTENATNISELDVNEPTGAGLVSQGDDEFRQLKDVLQNVFPGNTAPGVYQVDQNVTPYGYFGRFMQITEDLTVGRQILASPQVAIGLTTIDGVLGVITGPNEGIDAVTKEGTGLYDIQLAETQWDSIDDLILCGSAAMGLTGAGLLQLALPTGSGHTTATGWVQVITFEADGQTAIADAETFKVAIFDAGRD